MRLQPSVLVLALGAAWELPVPLPARAIPPEPARMACPRLTVLEQRALEAPPAEVDISQFSTTTRLKGTASFTIGGSGSFPEAPPATLNPSAFSTTTRLRAQIVWSPPSPSCGGQGVDVTTGVGSASIAARDPLEALINDLRRQASRKPLDPLPESLRREILDSYIQPVAGPMLRGAPCDHDIAAWGRLQDWGAARGFRPQSEVLACPRPSGGGWERDLIEQWRQSSIHYPILLRDADALSCHRSALDGREVGLCITWRRTDQALRTAIIQDAAGGSNSPAGIAKSLPSDFRLAGDCTTTAQGRCREGADACTSLLSWYVFLPACIQANPAFDGP